MALDEYQRKRDFAKTPEPSGGESSGGSLAFVVQEHAATAHHYDFRLELDGVLLSWAIPKGPSYDPKDKRLAVRTEDHPLDYASFEGTIPEGEYGGGTVIVWDRGTWLPHGKFVDDPQGALANGELKFVLHGEKLNGRWVLIRLKPRGNEKRENWLLIKERDEFARPADEYDVREAEPQSVITSRTIEQVAEEEGPQGHPDPLPTDTTTPPDPSAAEGAEQAPMPEHVDLELCKLVSEAPTGEDWIAEVKYDGYRALVTIDHGKVRALSRNAKDWTDRFEQVVRAAEHLPARTAVLDGEVVVFDDNGLSSFQLLQDALGARPDRLTYACFDLLYLDGYDLRATPLIERKRLLAALLAGEPPTGTIRFADHVTGHGEEFYAQACRIGLEGAVLKRIGSPYRGSRSGAWVKVKCRQEQEFVVGGFTDPSGSRVGFGSLLLGYYDGDDLVYAGRVGTGFSDDQLTSLHERLVGIETQSAPYADPPGGDDLHWVEPTLVAEVRFQEWTGDDVLRQPVFLGMRQDKDAREVRREAPRGGPPPPPATGGDPVVAGVTISSPAKQLFPESSLTKVELARYYEQVAPRMLPHVADRGLTLLRCPTGNEKNCFWQRHDDVSSAGIKSFTYTLPGKDEAEQWLYVEDVSDLVSLAQMGTGEIHVWGSRTDTPNQPDRLVFDLDPGPGLDWDEIVDAATTVRDLLVELGFVVYVKTTGGKGLHVVVPIEPVYDFERMRAFTKAVVDHLVGDHAERFVGRMAKAERGGKVFLDYLRNSLAASAVAPYSTRVREGAPVSVPVTWDELEAGLDPHAFDVPAVLRRLETTDDPWADMARHQAPSRVIRDARAELES